MPVLQLVNVSGASVFFRSGGVNIAHLPNGFDGSMNLDGSIGVYTGNLVVVSTNYVPADTTPTVFNLINNSGVPGSYQILGTDATGHDVNFSWSDNGSERQITLFTAEQTRDAAIVNYTLTGVIGTAFNGFGGFTPHLGASTNITTNVLMGTHLGDFESEGLKAVVLHPESISTTNYAREVEAVSVGFGLAFTVLVFSFILRLFRAIPSQGGDF